MLERFDPARLNVFEQVIGVPAAMPLRVRLLNAVVEPAPKVPYGAVELELKPLRAATVTFYQRRDVIKLARSQVIILAQIPRLNQVPSGTHESREG